MLRPSRLLPVVLIACLTVTAFAHDDPVATKDERLEHRRLEAANKEKLVKRLLAAQEKATPNQGLYDVTHYDLDLDLNPTSQILSGTVTVTATVTGASLATMDLDLDSGMAVSAATAGGVSTGHAHVGGVVTVTLDRSYATGESVTVAVTYAGNPAGGSFGWDSHNGQPMIWTLSEPFGARDWWPCKDLNTDKADSIDIRVTVPSSLIVASQGLLVSDTTVGSDRTFHWHSDYPINTYLVSLAIYPYQLYSDWYTPLGGGDPMEVQFFVYPDHYTTVQSNYALTVPMIEAFAQAYGEYPFVNEKYGHAEFTWGGGMEHQTISSMGGWSMDLISHELAHQWWGDMVTCADFGHIWLNEGFATWSEAYWAEQQQGFSVYQEYMELASYFGGGTIFVENPLTDSIFDSNLSYNKGSWIVHMLRGVLGDADFFAGLAAYRAAHEYGSATTEQLRDHFEAVSGRDLDAFFQQWIYGEYFPVYSLDWQPGPAVGQITVTIEQHQTNAGVFTMPVPVRVTTDLGVSDFKVENDQASQQFVLSVGGTIESVELDPDRWILRKVQTTVKNPSLDQGILLVNGVQWGTYGTEITNAHRDSVFTGTLPFDFWDAFDEPAGGYIAQLPAPLGHGPVPADVIGGYSAVVWVGNNYNGDLPKWQETPILSYLEAGGNVLLLSRMSSAFLDGALADYLDVTFTNWNATLGNSLAVAPGMVNLPFTGTQSWNDVYSTVVGPETTLLMQDTAGFSGVRGTGALRIPAAGGRHRPDGGRLAHLAGRPYRMDAASLRANTDFILRTHFAEPYVSPSAVEDGPAATLPAALRLDRNYPNPFNPQTVIPYSLPRAMSVTMKVYDARGRLVRTLVDDDLRAGDHTARWNGLDDAGRDAPSGSYFVRLTGAGGLQSARSILLVR